MSDETIDVGGILDEESAAEEVLPMGTLNPIKGDLDLLDATEDENKETENTSENTEAAEEIVEAEEEVEAAKEEVVLAKETVESEEIKSEKVEVEEEEEVEAAKEVVESEEIKSEKVEAEEVEAAAEIKSEKTEKTVESKKAVKSKKVESENSEEVVESEDLIYELPETEESGKARQQSPYDRPGKWYVVSITSGQEKLAKSNLETRTQTMNVASKVFEVAIPLEEQVEFKGTKKEVVQKKVFPGYILVRCHLDDETWHVIRNTPSITAFIGAGTKPIPLKREEVETFLGEKGDGQNAQRKIRPRLRYEVGETVRVKEGPFTDFQGEVTEINEDQLKVKLLLNIFGRETPVELEFSQVSKQ